MIYFDCHSRRMQESSIGRAAVVGAEGDLPGIVAESRLVELEEDGPG